MDMIRVVLFRGFDFLESEFFKMGLYLLKDVGFLVFWFNVGELHITGSIHQVSVSESLAWTSLCLVTVFQISLNVLCNNSSNQDKTLPSCYRGCLSLSLNNCIEDQWVAEQNQTD